MEESYAAVNASKYSLEKRMHHHSGQISAQNEANDTAYHQKVNGTVNNSELGSHEERKRQEMLKENTDKLAEIAEKTLPSRLSSAILSPFISVQNPTRQTINHLAPHIQRPSLQQRMLSAASTETWRSSLNPLDISYRALTYISDELLHDIPDSDTHAITLFQGYQASHPGREQKRLRYRTLRSHKDGDDELTRNQHARNEMIHQLDTLLVRKTLASNEIKEIDNKIETLQHMRAEVISRLADLEQQEQDTEHELSVVESKIESLGALVGTAEQPTDIKEEETLSQNKLPSQPEPRLHHGKDALSWQQRRDRRKSTPILHEHFQPGSQIKSFVAHDDAIISLDFDMPFGRLVTSSANNQVKVWDLSKGNIQGVLEGHKASVHCLHIEDSLLATGSNDATIKLWDLGQIPNESSYQSALANILNKSDFSLDDEDDEEDEDYDEYQKVQDKALSNGKNTLPKEPIVYNNNCLYTLEAHVDEITAIYFRDDTLVSGSADKTIRQWDLNTGRCVQTLDAIWSSATQPGRRTSYALMANNYLNDTCTGAYIGALQFYDAALASGTADGVVRLWDLRTGQVHRILSGHTAGITCLQFDETHLVTGSLDRSIRIWDLRMGAIEDAFAYEHGITSFKFDSRRIVSAAGESHIKVYDRLEGRHWNCGDVNETSNVLMTQLKEGYLVEGRANGRIGIWAM